MKDILFYIIDKNIIDNINVFANKVKYNYNKKYKRVYFIMFDDKKQRGKISIYKFVLFNNNLNKLINGTNLYGLEDFVFNIIKPSNTYSIRLANRKSDFKDNLLEIRNIIEQSLKEKMLCKKINNKHSEKTKERISKSMKNSWKKRKQLLKKEINNMDMFEDVETDTKNIEDIITDLKEDDEFYISSLKFNENNLLENIEDKKNNLLKLDEMIEDLKLDYNKIDEKFKNEFKIFLKYNKRKNELIRSLILLQLQLNKLKHDIIL